MIHPRDVLLDAQAATGVMPVCDHYSGVPDRMRKSLQLQAQMRQEFGACVFDVTLDCEDGAPVGGERDHAALVAELALGAEPAARVAARIHPIGHDSFADDLRIVAGQAAKRLTHLMIPKVESLADVQQVDRALRAQGPDAAALPIHVLLESQRAVHAAFEIAAHPRVQSISFGLMDFVSSHNGAIGAQAMTVAGQFTHPLVVRAKLEIAAACHASGKVPSHCVVTEFADGQALQQAAERAARELGYTRMWSIHPNQIRPILAAFAPNPAELQTAADLLTAAQRAQWAPISFEGRLHDRASYRYYWQLLERGRRTGVPLPQAAQGWFE
jgi:citrate lyase subunit beta/citryl-CoA lyase